MRYLLVAGMVGVVSVGCAPDIQVDEGEGVAPVVEFDPGNSIIPFPNNLLLDPMTGEVNLPEQCNEGPAQTALRELVLNELNGFGTFKTQIVVNTTEPVAASSLEGRVKMFKRADTGVPVDPADAVEVPLVLVPTQSARSSADCSETSLVPALAIIPAIPLDQNSTYTVVLTDGITSEGGDAFVTSPTWALVRLENNPVTVEDGVIVSEVTPFDPVTDAATLLGLDLLHRAHAPALDFLDLVVDGQRNEILLAWDFNTQTTTVPLDAAIADTPANTLPADPLGGVFSILAATGDTVQEFIEARLGPGACMALPCAAVGDVLSGQLDSPNYQTETTNPLGDPLKGPWSDPVSPSMVRAEAISVLVFIPTTAGPYPTVIFGHGLTRSNGDLLAIGSQLAAAGIATVAINWVAHGDRAVQISNDAALGCSGVLDPTTAPQCFQPILSSDLATSRDSLRQSVLDGLALVEALKACDNGACGALDVNPMSIGYIGQSLGGIIGAMLVAMGADIETAVINVGAVGLLDVVENTDSLGIKCPLVDALIDAGVVVGDKFDPGAGTGICTTDEWQVQPGYRQFAGIARWVLDPSDGANYLSRWGARPILIQRVINDQVVPNVATEQMALLRGLTAQSAALADTAATAAPTPAIAADDGMPLWVDYANADPGNGTTDGNTYTHGSLLAPAGGPLASDGTAATAQMQTDAIVYLLNNLN
jgi:dienelactone hydrolase